VARIVDELRRSGEAVVSLVAEHGTQIAGHVMFGRLKAPMRALVLSPLGVLPEFQKAGIGSALVRKGLERAREQDWQAVFLVGSPVYYGRFGFSAAAAEGYTSPYYVGRSRFASLTTPSACRPDHVSGRLRRRYQAVPGASGVAESPIADGLMSASVC
jgi:predicted N-acetyltransferase YhbS